MKLSDFKEERSGIWRREQPVETSFGTFQVELYAKNRGGPPDDEMLRLAEELVRYAQARSEYIREIVFGSYRYHVTEADPDWLMSWEVPADLKPEQIRQFCDPILVVTRNPKFLHEGPPYDCGISVHPQWEPEHGLYLEFRPGAIVSVDHSSFSIVDGILRTK